MTTDIVARELQTNFELCQFDHLLQYEEAEDETEDETDDETDDETGDETGDETDDEDEPEEAAVALQLKQVKRFSFSFFALLMIRRLCPA